jgi:hypothetical protein
MLRNFADKVYTVGNILHIFQGQLANNYCSVVRFHLERDLDLVLKVDLFSRGPYDLLQILLLSDLIWNVTRI